MFYIILQNFTHIFHNGLPAVDMPPEYLFAHAFQITVDQHKLFAIPGRQSARLFQIFLRLRTVPYRPDIGSIQK